MVALSLGATSPKGEQMIPKGYKHTELGVLPEDWEVVRLGDVCDVRDGTHESPKPKDEGKILITSKNLKNGRIDFSDSYYISLEDFESINKRSKVEKYDVLMSMIGTVGEVALIDCVPDFAIKNVALFKTNGDIKLSRYLFYFFQSPSGKKCISSFLSGSTQKYITLDFLILDFSFTYALSNACFTDSNSRSTNFAADLILSTISFTVFSATDAGCSLKKFSKSSAFSFVTNPPAAYSKVAGRLKAKLLNIPYIFS